MEIIPENQEEQLRWFAAHHEAAHAVAAVLLWVDMDEVTIGDRPSLSFRPGAGFTHLSGVSPDTAGLPENPEEHCENSLQLLRRQAITALAGAVAEGVLTGVDDWFLYVSDTDAKWFNDAMSATAGTEEERSYLSLLWVLDAEEFVRKHWERIEAVAAALLEHTSLDRNTVANWCTPHEVTEISNRA